MPALIDIRDEERIAYTPQETARKLGVSLRSVYGAVHRGELGACWLGGRLLIPARELDRLLAPTERRNN